MINESNSAWSGYLEQPHFSNDSTVNEAALLEEDKFWKLEILKKLQESSDELVARGLVEKMKIDIVKQSTTSSPARRDADYALSVYEAERAFELATLETS